MYHDLNSNDELDKNFLGIPTEPYAFSNNARGFGLPPYKKAMFKLDSREKILEITIK